MRKTKVLFLCTGNSARSQMAQALLQHHAGSRFTAYSAGVKPQGINPLTVKVMAELGISLEGQYSKDIGMYLGKEHFGYLITVCAHAEESCPSTFPGLGQRLSWRFDDPAKVEGTPEEKMQAFRQVRDQIQARIVQWMAENE